ncbi:MAG: transcriptional regulator [Paenibacillus sp.]|jgi:DNA-binding FadR family transcriptional regulator|nr:transcriptional regulator [Paenibacillus sp.]
MVSSEHTDLDTPPLLPAKPSSSSVDYVVSSIKELLLTKKVMPGDRLPTEMELAKQLSISRGPVREAMKILSALGIIEIRRGDGTYVSDKVGKVAFDPFLFNLILSQPDFNELKELRLLFEKDVIRLVIKNASDEDIQKLRRCYEGMNSLKNKVERKYEELLEYDLEFHAILGQISKNTLIEKIYQFVMEYFKPYIAQSLRKHTNFSVESIESHNKILEAVEHRNYTAAELAVENSLEVWENLIFK